MNEEITEKFETLKVLVETLQDDVIKNAQGNKSAGVRVRKGLRECKKIASELVKTSLTSDKS